MVHQLVPNFSQFKEDNETTATQAGSDTLIL